MIRTVFALATGGALGLGLIFQDAEQEAQEKEQKQTVITLRADGEIEGLEESEDTKKVILVELETKLAEMAARKAELDDELSSDHPRSKSLAAEIEAVRAVLTEIRELNLPNVAEIQQEVEIHQKQALEKEKAILAELKAKAANSGRKVQPGISYGFTVNGNRPGVLFSRPGKGATAQWHSGRLSSASFWGESAKWREADEEGRKKIEESVKAKLAEQFDDQLEERMEELQQLEQRYTRLKEMLESRKEKREQILDSKWSDLQMEWESQSKVQGNFKVFSAGENALRLNGVPGAPAAPHPPEAPKQVIKVETLKKQ